LAGKRIALQEENMLTQRVTVIYANKDGAKFDFDYYTQKHVPWVARLMGRSIEVRRGISSGAGAPAPYVCIATIAVNIADFKAVFAQHGADILADVPNYTNIEPTVQLDEILPEHESLAMQTAS
jgi:uncharacterized protein (TIGR02118 family)